jgi:hypothetical protein
LEWDLSTHLTSEATRQLKEKVSGRFQELQATGGVSGVASSVGMKVVNLLRSKNFSKDHRHKPIRPLKTK